jgi:hypothetical protein
VQSSPGNCRIYIYPIVSVDSLRNVDVREFIAFSALGNTIENQNIAICFRFKDQHVLIGRLFDMKDFVDFEGYSLARPLGRDFAEPAIWTSQILAYAGIL